MKRCGKCGAVQDDSRSTCIDCGAVLPKPMTDAEMAAHEEALDDTLYNMAEKTETFFVPRWARILGIASIVCFVGALLFLLLAPNRQYAQAEWVYGLVLPCSSCTASVVSAFCLVDGNHRKTLVV